MFTRLASFFVCWFFSRIVKDLRLAYYLCQMIKLLAQQNQQCARRVSPKHAAGTNMWGVISDEARCFKWGCRLTSTDCPMGCRYAINWAWIIRQLESAGNDHGGSMYCMCVSVKLELTQVDLFLKVFRGWCFMTNLLMCPLCSCHSLANVGMDSSTSSDPELE